MDVCFVFRHFHYSQVKLDTTAVKKEVELLKRFCNEGENRVLKSVRYTSGLNYLHISLVFAGKAVAISTNAGYSKYKKGCVLPPQKTWKSLYLSDSSLPSHQSVHVYCSIAVYLSCPSKIFNGMCTSSGKSRMCPLFQVELTPSVKILSQPALKYDIVTMWLCFSVADLYCK